MKIFFLFFSLSLFSHQNFYDYIYTQDASKFYQAQSRQEFLDLKHQAYQQVVLSGLVPIAAILATYSFWPSQPGAPTQTLQTYGFLASLGAMGFFVSQTLSGLIQNTLAPYTYELQEPLSGFVNSFRRYLLGPPHDDIQELEIKYILIKPKLATETQNIIESSFEKIRKNFSPQGLRSSTSPKEDPELIVIKRILQLPIGPKNLNFNETLFQIEFAAYQEMASEDPLFELKRFCHSLSIASQHENPRLKSALYFKGPPGVGKTEAALKLGKVLGLPVIKINLAELRGIGDLKGVKCEFSEDSRCTPGLIAYKLLENLYTNAILFFDEADQILNRIQEGQSHELVSFMLELLEGKTQFIDNPYFGIKIDIRHFGIILAGNEWLINKALKTRLGEVLFGNYTEDYRIKVGRERFLPEILQDYTGILTQDNFSAKDFEIIDSIAKSEHQKFLAQAEDPGFRNQIRMIERFVHQKAQVSPSAKSSAN